MKKIKVFLSLVLSFAAISLSAQNVTVKGVVTDTDGAPLPGATVQVQGTTLGVVTDLDGAYTISAPSNAVLSVSFIGYLGATAEVAGRKVIDFVLSIDSTSLEETIVVAYGVQKKSSFTGSAVQLSSDKIQKMQSTNISKSLEGAVAGLQVSSASGTPGSSGSIHIRGFGSVTASQQPLIVVDGVPYEGSFNSIDSQDIETITVLKDAAANSMYGARGSNGVIMITTKRGTSDKIRINFDAKMGVNTRGISPYEMIDDPASYYEMTWEAMRNAAYYGGVFNYAQSGIYASASMVQDAKLYNIYKGVADTEIVDPTTGKINANASELKWNDNWNKDVFRNGIRQEYNVSAAGGSDRTQAYMSASYLSDEGYVPNSGFERIAVRAKVDQQIGKFIRAGLNVAVSNTNQAQFSNQEGSNYSNIFMFAQNMPPIYPIYLYDLTTGERQYGKNGETLYDWGSSRAIATNANAYGQLMTSKYSTVRDNMSTRGYVSFDLTNNLTVSANVAYDTFNTKTDRFMTPAGGDALAVGGRGTQKYSRYAALNANQLLNWTPTIGENNFTLLLGHEIKSDNGYGLEGSMTQFVDKTVSDFDNALVYDGLNSSSEAYFLEGFFGRLEYNYANRYFLSTSFRRDGSSRFSKENRWGNFWSLGGSWNVRNEPFMDGVDFVDALKLKASYGTQGNDNLGYTKVYEDIYTITRVNGTASLTKTFRAAPDVTWETSNNFNTGFETRLFGLLDLAVEYYVKDINDMIYLRPLAPSQGDPANQLVNDMSMRNNGIEFDLSATLVNTKDLNWTVFANGTHYKNTITKLPEDKPQDGYQTGAYWREVGGSLYDFYLKEWAGVDPTNGLPQYNVYTETKDEDGNKIETVSITNKQGEASYRKTGKSPIPDLYGGFGTSLSFYGFDFSASFAYQIGGTMLDSVYKAYMTAGDTGNNWHKDIYRRWTPQNTNTDVPRVQIGYQDANERSTRFLIDASYLSLRDVVLGYTVPQRYLNNAGIQTLRFYLSANNVWYTSARKGLDTRQSFDGSVGYGYSAIRTVSAGVNIAF